MTISQAPAEQQQPTEQPRVLPEPFGLVSVAHCKAPEGAIGNRWFCYTLTQGQSTITGYRQGTKNEVTIAAEEMVVRLNERRAGKTGRVQLTPSPKRR